MDKVLFIVPPNIKYEDFISPAVNVKMVSRRSGIFGAVITDIPLGVLSLSAYLKKFASVQTELIDFNCILNKTEKFEFRSFAEFFHDFLALLRSAGYAPDIIGISALFSTLYQSMLDIAECCREIFPGAVIVAGGGIPTNMYNEIFRDSACFDALCYGEGEKPLLGLVEAGDKLRYLQVSPSWLTPGKIKRRRSFRQDFIEDLDEIPFYDFGILDVDDYRLNPTIAAYPSISEKERNLPVMTSRGCVYHCSFCSSHTVHGRRMRYYSINRVREDFIRLKDQYGVKTIIFQDDHFLANEERALTIIDIMKELQITAFFPNSLALHALHRKMLRALKNIGVNQLVLSVESGSSRVLKEIMHKPLDLSVVKRVVDDCRQLGIYTDVNVLIGLPGETKQDIDDARNFLKNVNANWFRINVATPLPGSEMLEICLKKHYLKASYTDCDYKKSIVGTEDFTSEYIQEMAYILNLDLNFAENSDFRLGNYGIALIGFENAIKAKNDHLLAYYYAAKCCEKLGNLKKAQQYADTARTIAAENSFWRKYAKMFNILI
ncbi:MAG: radical SAM protein [Candidatus Omnitrophica bacterium]|nr:radical SAM protein [Candidatus Omnitrophota bacterium]